MRPFESLEWYHEARRGHDLEHPWLSRARDFGLVRAHISAFALGAVALLAINLVHAPARVWADTAIAAWGLLVVIHAIVAGIVALILQLLAEDEELRPASEIRWEPLRAWTPPTAASRPSGPATENGTAPPGEPAPSASPEAGWRSPDADAGRATPPEERASWSEVAGAAWLARHRTGRAVPKEPAPAEGAVSSGEAAADGAPPADDNRPGSGGRER